MTVFGAGPQVCAALSQSQCVAKYLETAGQCPSWEMVAGQCPGRNSVCLARPSSSTGPGHPRRHRTDSSLMWSPAHVFGSCSSGPQDMVELDVRCSLTQLCRQELFSSNCDHTVCIEEPVLPVLIPDGGGSSCRGDKHDSTGGVRGRNLPG